MLEKEVEEFLEHYGVKGQQWGVRRKQRVQAHLDRVSRVAKGTATTKERLRTAGGGLVSKKSAGRALRRGATFQKKLADGTSFTSKLISKKEKVFVSELNYHQKD